MYPLMRITSTRLCESSATISARITFLATMNPRVFLKTRRTDETFRTCIAFVWFFSGMRTSVYEQMIMHQKTAIACCTFEWSFAIVLSHVYFQFTVVCAFLAAFRASSFGCGSFAVMLTSMGAELYDCCKRFLTVCALELLFGMNEPMHLQVAGLSKSKKQQYCLGLINKANFL